MDAIIKGIKLMGGPFWSAIKTHFADFNNFKDRTPGQIKDKARNMRNKGHFGEEILQLLDSQR